MEVKFAALSEIGKVRAHNEDYYGIDESTPNGKVYVVCDGMGGHVGGATASRLAVNSLLEYFKKEKYDNIILEIDKAFQFANEQIFAHTLSEPQLKGMGTTAVILIIKKEECYIGHVGDSRIYIKADKKLHRLTKDHSYVQGLVDAGVISDDEAEKHPQKNQIMKALGHTSEVKGTICKKPFRVKAGDIFLLCSDGLNGMINDAVIESLINGSDLEKSKIDLFEAAMTNGGLDNITALLVNVTNSKYYGKNEFKSYNPIERGRHQEDNFDKTSGFSKTMQLDNSNRYVPKKKKWIPYLLGGSVGLLVMVISLFLIFPSGKGKEENGGLDKTKNTQVVQSLTKNELEEKSFDELIQLADKATLVSDNISDNDQINTSDRKTAILHIKESKLISVEIQKKSPPIENPAPTPPIETPKISKKDKTKNQETPKATQDENRDFISINGKLGIYKIQTHKEGETIKQLIFRIKNESRYSCKNPGTKDEIIKLNKENPEKKTKEVYKKLVDDETFLLKGIWIWVKCK